MVEIHDPEPTRFSTGFLPSQLITDCWPITADAPAAGTKRNGFRPEVHPKFLDRRPHRSRQEHPRRPASAAVGSHHAARVSRAVARRHGPRARARHHDQGARGRDQLHARRPGLRAEPDRHARATSTSTTRSRGAWPRARERSCWSTRPRGSRPRRSPTPTSR